LQFFTPLINTVCGTLYYICPFTPKHNAVGLILKLAIVVERSYWRCTLSSSRGLACRADSCVASKSTSTLNGKTRKSNKNDNITIECVATPSLQAARRQLGEVAEFHHLTCVWRLRSARTPEDFWANGLISPETQTASIVLNGFWKQSSLAVTSVTSALEVIFLTRCAI